MALLPASFIHPVGKLQPSMFPGEDLTAIVTVWIADAVTMVASLAPSVQDTAGAFWVYYRAYDAIAQRVGASPSSYSYGGNSGGGVQSTVNWGQNKSDYWAKLAQEALDAFNTYVPAEPPRDKGWSFRVY